jgi:hypothetical protein
MYTKLIDGLKYYGQYRTDQYKNQTYAAFRAEEPFTSTADTVFDDNIWIAREFLNAYDRTQVIST